MSENESFAGFGKKFQESLAQLIFEDRGFSDQIGEIIDYSFFELKFHREFVQKVYQYKKDYEVHPSKEIFGTFLKTEFNNSDLVSEQVKNFFEQIKNEPIKDVKFIKDKSIEFCKNQKIKEAIMRSVELLGDKKYDKIEKIVREAVGLGLENEVGHSFKEDFEARYSDEYRKVVPTGWKHLNKEMIEGVPYGQQGGLGPGETGIIIAPTNSGKSFILSHIGASAILQGFNVVHFIMELTPAKIGKRYDSIISTIPLNDLRTNKEKVWDDIKNINGELEIIKYLPNTVTVNTLCNRLEKIKKRNKTGFKPDLIIVDYGDLLNPSDTNLIKVDALQSVFNDLQRMAEQFEVPLWTATQVNRCLKSDTRLFIKRDDELFEVPISETKIGDQVDTHLGWKKILEKYDSKEKLYRIKLKSGREVVCSSKHLFPTADGELLSINNGLCMKKRLLLKK